MSSPDEGPIFEMGQPGYHRTCKHFDGINFTDPAKKCKAGVVMAEITVMTGYRYRRKPSRVVYSTSHSLPCFSDSDPLGVCECEHRCLPTDAEVAEHTREITAALDRMAVAYAAVQEAAQGRRGIQGEIPCPVCKIGTLHYSVAKLNGHIWGACSSEECVRWMQ